MIVRKDKGNKGGYSGKAGHAPAGAMKKVVEAITATPDLLKTASDREHLQPPQPLPGLRPEDVIAIQQKFNGWKVTVERDAKRYEGFVSSSYVELPQLTDKTRQACAEFLEYIRTIVEPARRDLQAEVDAGTVVLHRLFGANLCVAHAVDYIYAIRNADGFKEGRKDLVAAMDKVISVDGARIRNRKFELIDAVNNAFKHIRIDLKRYPEVEKIYGPVSFQCLVQDKGRVLCILEGFRFDYARAVLLPAFEALCDWNFSTTDDIRRFARGDFEVLPWSSDARIWGDDDWDDPIDRFLDMMHPHCLNCREYEADCQCAEYVFNGKKGEFEARFGTAEEFDEVMSRISGAYRRERD
ncbi:hypothetical protein [Pseudomonas nitroreducens]|uniref:Uncharacterized protein n=1 Tax=Pseudomonas nitroreducens TaxID=46680 RepID=A0A6G6J7F7_PSENT|nr:hypothetical protein [Pseudomonas nitroreducens]QIE91356.1 hypothetical protein G5B91_33960 [Pseudomonas nitroreducens]HBO6302951.1 hypothetical protein [Pseudomonas aeruginosa]